MELNLPLISVFFPSCQFAIVLIKGALELQLTRFISYLSNESRTFITWNIGNLLLPDHLSTIFCQEGELTCNWHSIAE